MYNSINLINRVLNNRSEMMAQLTIKYIYHSGYSICSDGECLVFDYYEGSLPDFNKDKNITFFVTHSHQDHFNDKILELPGSKDYTYIFSSDIADLERVDNIIYLGGTSEMIEDKKKMFAPNINYMKPNELQTFGNLSVRTFGSTDLGVSYLVNFKGVNIFHAGDLNLWIWDEDTEEERVQMREDFMKEINKIKHYDVDIAFFPLDPRLKSRYADGAKIFIDEVSPSLLFPMHFKDDVSYNLSFLSEFNEYKSVYRPIFKKNQIFLINFEG